MAINGRFRVAMEDVFPHGAYVVSEVVATRDFDRSTKERAVQAVDKESGVAVWDVQVMDADPAATKRQKTVTIKIAATHQPVPPSAGGLPFAAVEFEGLTVTPYVDESGGRPRVAYSIRASGMRAPGKRGVGSSAGDVKVA
jgi:hypothetical protein